MEILLIPILSLIAIVGLAVAVDDSTVVFDPISAPPEWQSRGYTSKVVSYRLTDAIRRMNEKADTFKHGRGVRLGTDKTVTHELGSYLGLAGPIWIARKEMGLIEFTIGGEIVLRDKEKGTYQFLLRSSGVNTTVLTSTECGSIDKPDMLIQLAAEQALRVVDPYILAAYYFDGEEDAYYDAREKIQAEDLGEEAKSEVGEKMSMDDTCGESSQNVGPFQQTVEAIRHSLETLPVADRKWAHDRWGLVYLVKREYQLAIEKFKDALAIDPKFAIAIHNWGVALADQGKCRLAIDKYQEAIAAEGGRLPGVYNSWAVALGKLGDSEEAI